MKCIGIPRQIMYFKNNRALLLISYYSSFRFLNTIGRASFRKYRNNSIAKSIPKSIPKSIASELVAHQNGQIESINCADSKLIDFEGLNEMKSILDSDIQYAVAIDDKDEKEVFNFDCVELYGYADSLVPFSDVTCHGCGVKLHCQNPAIPGYMPSQLFKSKTNVQLKQSCCQRCDLMNKYNFALNVSVSSKEYTNIISKLYSINCLAVVIIDILDMHNSIYPDLSKLIGMNKPLYIVGNKIDMLPGDRLGYLDRIKDNLRDHCIRKGLGTKKSIRHVALISAKTGYGIEQLVSKLLLDWYRRGQVYIIGCTNSGKSTLFNALLSSDYCNANVRSVINRATTCSWPGTTLNLLKFPIVNPTGPFLYQRKERLHHLEADGNQENILERTRGKLSYKQTLLGHIGMTVESNRYTFHPSDIQFQDSAMYTFNPKRGQIMNTADRKENIPDQLSYTEKTFKKSRWCYDTPGLVNENQIINRMNQEELSVLLNQDQISYRNYRLKMGDVMFISGLGRVDVLFSESKPIFTVFTNKNIPIHVVKSDIADRIYKQNIGTSYFGIPLGDSSRLNKIPSLIGKEIEIKGVGFDKCATDVTMSSMGWFSVTAADGCSVRIRVYLPGGAGCAVTNDSLLPFINSKFDGSIISKVKKRRKKTIKKEDVFGISS